MKNINLRTTSANQLISETSPYLLLHAHNPVNWYPWGVKAIEKAKKENKLIIVSIGYSACHWCHVMEKESFSDPEVARVMNKHFISIKVDREERPDIDQIYMTAAQLLHGTGGWPLNAFTLPDGKPFFAGTYFPKTAWISLLIQINDLYQQNPEKIKAQAQTLSNGIISADSITFRTEKADFERKDLEKIFRNWENQIDIDWGGLKGSPKFPLPMGYEFLLKYQYVSGDKKAIEAVTTTLDRMASGGIYDQIGGGFARYSTDKYWKVPHFEKMLYDNAQLVSLYSKAFQVTRKLLYKQVVYETLDFVSRELTAPEFSDGEIAFYSSLDADTEGKEGQFYTWTKKEIQDTLGDRSQLISDFYNLDPQGNWEAGKNILYRNKTLQHLAEEYNISVGTLKKYIAEAREKLKNVRGRRTRPALDDKILASWNALMLSGYLDAYRVFDEENFLITALKNATFVKKNLITQNGRMDRNFNKNKNKSPITGMLDDYAFTIQAFISLYQSTFEEKWLFLAERLLIYTLNHFFDKKQGMFFYTSDKNLPLMTPKIEINDNVMPSSNSVMAKNLYFLGVYFYKNEYIRISKQMLNNLKSNLLQHSTYFANWAILMTHFIQKPIEVAIIGNDCIRKRKELDQHYLPFIILLGGNNEGKLPLLKNKYRQDQTLIYVCKNKTCLLPVSETKAALKLIGEN